MAVREEFERANNRGRELWAATPRAVTGRYDRRTRRIVIGLGPHAELRCSPGIVQGLEAATPAELDEIEVSRSGLGVHFPKLDADLYLPAILEGVLGTKKWMASRLGQTGGRSRSGAKQMAARANGKLGGRPKRKKEISGEAKNQGKSKNRPQNQGRGNLRRDKRHCTG